MDQITEEDCIALLRNKYEEIKSQARSDYPKRADFSENEVVAIKQHLGPWPRALEKAGVKPVNDALMEKKKLKIIEKKRKKRKDSKNV